MHLSIFRARNVIIGLGVTLSSTSSVFAALGDVRATFPFYTTSFVADPNQPFMYASISNSNTLVVIDTHTLALAYSITLPGSPEGMAMTSDGHTLYVADSTNHTIDVIDTQTFSLVRSIPASSAPRDVVVGLDNRLFVLDWAAGVYQIDATTGGTTGPGMPWLGSFGNLQISPDRSTLYYGPQGRTAIMEAYDVSGISPFRLRQVRTGNSGQELALSHDGTTIAQPNGSPHRVTLFRSSDFTPLGEFDTGAYPGALAFSPDDKVAYVSHAAYPTQVDIYNSATFARLGHFEVSDSAKTMLVDQAGHNLFVSHGGAFSQDTVVYAVPEPGSLAWLLLGFIVGCRRME